MLLLEILMANILKKKCPKCKSKELVPFIGFETGSYECKKCGYIGAFIIEMDK